MFGQYLTAPFFLDILNHQIRPYSKSNAVPVTKKPKKVVGLGVDELELYDIKSVFSINIIMLTDLLINQYCFLVKCFLLSRAVALKNFIDCLVIIPSHFLIGHPAVALGRGLVFILHLMIILVIMAR